MDYRRERLKAFRATVAFRLGPSLGEGLVWNARTTLPTLASDEPVRQLADRLGANNAAWLYDESSAVPLEACEGRWKPAVQALTARPSDVPSVSEPVAAFNAHIRPMERAAHTRGKHKTHRLSVLTRAVRKGILPQSLPMSEELVRAFVWDALCLSTA